MFEIHDREIKEILDAKGKKAIKLYSDLMVKAVQADLVSWNWNNREDDESTATSINLLVGKHIARCSFQKNKKVDDQIIVFLEAQETFLDALGQQLQPDAGLRPGDLVRLRPDQNNYRDSLKAVPEFRISANVNGCSTPRNTNHPPEEVNFKTFLEKYDDRFIEVTLLYSYYAVYGKSAPGQRSNRDSCSLFYIDREDGAIYDNRWDSYDKCLGSLSEDTVQRSVFEDSPITTLHQVTKGKGSPDILGPYLRIIEKQAADSLKQLPGQELGLIISGPEGRGSRTTVRVEWYGLEGEREKCLVSDLEPLRRHDASSI